MNHIFAVVFVTIFLLSNTGTLHGQRASPKKKPAPNAKPIARQPTRPPADQTFSQIGSPTVVINDLTGSVENERPGITKISLQSDGERVNASIELKNEVISTFLTRLSSPILEFFFDTDLRTATGGTLANSDRNGFDREVTVYLCFLYEKGEGSTCMGSLQGAKIKEFFIGVGVKERSAAVPWSTGSILSPLDPPYATLRNNRIIAAIPYTALGARSGQTLRIVSGSYADYSGKAFSGDLFLKLK
jgi:hypothetical protein